MKLTVVIIIFPILLVLTALAVLAVMSNSGTPAGIKNGKLTACSAKPNCVCSEFGSDKHHLIATIPRNNQNNEQLGVLIRSTIEQMGGKLQHSQPDYIAATFKSRLFKFVDDFEIRMSDEGLHIRSASRVGYSDNGVNRKRAEQFRQLLSQQLVDL